MHDVMKGGTDRKHRESTAVVNVLVWIIRRWYENEKRRKEQEHSHVRIELQNLKNQLNPHFLFNALNNIYSFIGSDSDHARRSLDSLCELLRYALYRSDRPEVYFREEVSFIRNYIDLAGERLPDDTDQYGVTDNEKYYSYLEIETM